MKLKDFSKIVLKYKVIFFDAYGVLKTYKGAIPGIENTFTYLKRHGIDFYILTNDASRGPVELANAFQKQGLSDVTPNKIISSGMIAREFLRYKVKEGRVAYLGTENSAHYIETLGLETVPISVLDLNDAPKINALVLLDDEGFDWNHDLNKMMNLIRIRNIPVVVANTDEAYPVSKNEVAIAIGGIADMMEDISGKKFIRFGKPGSQMFTFAFEHVQKNGTPVNRDEILMVGDTLYTDIIGGNKFGLDTALTLTGNTLPHQFKSLIQSTGIIPNYICETAVVFPEL